MLLPVPSFLFSGTPGFERGGARSPGETVARSGGEGGEPNGICFNRLFHPTQPFPAQVRGRRAGGKLVLTGVSLTPSAQQGGQRWASIGLLPSPRWHTASTGPALSQGVTAGSAGQNRESCHHFSTCPFDLFACYLVFKLQGAYSVLLTSPAPLVF